MIEQSPGLQGRRISTIIIPVNIVITMLVVMMMVLVAVAAAAAAVGALSGANHRKLKMRQIV